MDRLARTLDTDEMRVAFAFLLTMPGAPFIYYGDEIGMRYVEDLTSVEGGYGRTGSRSPMQWNKGLNAGFSSAKAEMLYVPLDSSKDRPDAESQSKDSTSLRSEVKGLISFRQKNPALQSRGEIEFLSSGYPLVYRRKGEGQSIMAVINPKDETTEIKNVNGKIIYTVGHGASLENGKLIIKGSAAVFVEE